MGFNQICIISFVQVAAAWWGGDDESSQSSRLNPFLTTVDALNGGDYGLQSILVMIKDEAESADSCNDANYAHWSSPEQGVPFPLDTYLARSTSYVSSLVSISLLLTDNY